MKGSRASKISLTRPYGVERQCVNHQLFRPITSRGGHISALGPVENNIFVEGLRFARHRSWILYNLPCSEATWFRLKFPGGVYSEIN